LNDFRSKSFAIPLSLDIIDVNRYSSIVFPHAPGAAFDLAENKDLGILLCQFVKHKSIHAIIIPNVQKYAHTFLLPPELVCAIGMGVAALFSAKQESDQRWAFKSFSMTGVSQNL